MVLDEKSLAHTKNLLVYQDQATKMKCALTTAYGNSSPDINLSTKIIL
jgi:hypothetical protein